MSSKLTIADDCVVTIHYTLRDLAGEVRDSSAGGDGLPYLHGYGNIVPGLEAALAGRSTGDKLTEVQIAPEHGYGVHDPRLDLSIARTTFPPEMLEAIEVGAQFMAEHPEDEGDNVLYTVLGLEGENVLVSGNHPLAGDVLVFDVEVLEIRAATAEELEHGHVHGQHGHGHDHDHDHDHDHG